MQKYQYLYDVYLNVNVNANLKQQYNSYRKPQCPFIDMSLCFAFVRTYQ